jgi:DNA polymerase elongation subunit (family B)
MIVNYEYLNGKLIISYINKKGNTEFKNYTWHNPTEWKVCSPTDPAKVDGFRTWDGKPLKREMTRYPSRYSVYEFIHKLPQSEKDDLFTLNDPKMYFCDIEVEITEGFPEAHLANNRVTAICIIHDKKILLLGIKDLADNEITRMNKDINKYLAEYENNYTLEWCFCETETEMLALFFNELVKKMPVLTGWNFINYDWVYLVTRARKLGINPNVASPTGKLIKPWKRNQLAEKPTYEELPKHRMVFDYMDIFAKWDTSIKIKESNSLDFIAGKVLGVKKLEFDPGENLKTVYTSNYYKYMLYNCIDTALVQQIHNKQKTYDNMLAISNFCKIQIEDSISAIRVTEGIFFGSYYDQGVIMVKHDYNANPIGTDDVADDTEDDLNGGFVKFPSVGLKTWTTVFDFSSLYPTIMRQFNIAPESYKGLKINDKECMLNGIVSPIEKNDIVLINGTVFKNEYSITKQLIENLFAERKFFKFQALHWKKQEQLLKEYYAKRQKELA